jgi:hypothetical protein
MKVADIQIAGALTLGDDFNALRTGKEHFLSKPFMTRS